ncbi:MAG TPA: hypothetical protein VG838_17145 [Opitutaceae bacterium]|nr:hypothetical protein [Opitutaceae bacterium]
MNPKRLAFFLFLTAALVAGTLVYRRLHPRKLVMNPPVAIQDGKTIDFSSGKPVVKDSTRQKADIDAKVKEIDDAVKDVRFDQPAAAAR